MLAFQSCAGSFSGRERCRGSAHGRDNNSGCGNIVRVNDVVLPRTGFPRSEALLRDSGFAVTTLNTDEVALIDGGLSCMSLRFSLTW